MTLGNIALITTAIATLITAIGGIVVTIKVMIPSLNVNRDTHKLVNQQRTDMLRFQAVLIDTLKANDIKIPEDQSKISIEGV